MTDWEKRARALLPPRGSVYELDDALAREAAIKLGREMADARAEEIALRLLCSAGPGPDVRAAAIARSTITKPQTREQALEEALRDIANTDYPIWGAQLIDRAKEALKWKP